MILKNMGFFNFIFGKGNWKIKVVTEITELHYLTNKDFRAQSPDSSWIDDLLRQSRKDGVGESLCL